MLPPAGRLRGPEAQTTGDARAQIWVDLGPVLVYRTLLDEALDPVAQVADDVARQMVAIGRRHHVAVEHAGLDEVAVFFVRHVGRAHDLGGRHGPARIRAALRIGR